MYEEEGRDKEYTSNLAMGLGGLGFLGGSVSKRRKTVKTGNLKRYYRNQSAFKSAVVHLLTSEINDLEYVNQKMSSCSRRISTTTSSIATRLQSKIFDAYSMAQTKKMEVSSNQHYGHHERKAALKEEN